MPQRQALLETLYIVHFYMTHGKLKLFSESWTSEATDQSVPMFIMQEVISVPYVESICPQVDIQASD